MEKDVSFCGKGCIILWNGVYYFVEWGLLFCGMGQLSFIRSSILEKRLFFFAGQLFWKGVNIFFVVKEN